MNLHVWGKFSTNMNDRVEESQNIRFFRNILAKYYHFQVQKYFSLSIQGLTINATRCKLANLFYF